MKKILISFIVLICAVSIKAQEKINWLSFEKAIELNKKNPKPILLDIYTDWCGYCKKMDKETYSNAVIINYVNQHFYAVKLDGEGKNNITYKGYTFKHQKQGNMQFHELAAAFMDGKLSYPTTIFMNEKEELLESIPGYLTAKHFEKVLAFFKTEAYNDQTWVEFEKNFKSSIQ